MIENIIDKDRSENVFGLATSLNMLIETREGFDFTGSEINNWCRKMGYSSSEIIPLACPSSAALAYKLKIVLQRSFSGIPTLRFIYLKKIPGEVNPP